MFGHPVISRFSVSNNHFGEIISQSTDTLVDRLATALPEVSRPIKPIVF